MELELIINEIDYVVVSKDGRCYELQIDKGKFNGTVMDVTNEENRLIETRSEKQPIVLAALEAGWIEI